MTSPEEPLGESPEGRSRWIGHVTPVLREQEIGKWGQDPGAPPPHSAGELGPSGPLGTRDNGNGAQSRGERQASRDRSQVGGRREASSGGTCSQGSPGQGRVSPSHGVQLSTISVRSCGGTRCPNQDLVRWDWGSSGAQGTSA